jgi:hypothetical protein
MAAYIVVQRPAPPEPGLHPRPSHSMPYLDAPVFGFACAALYLAGRAAWDVWRDRP